MKNKIKKIIVFICLLVISGEVTAIVYFGFQTSKTQDKCINTYKSSSEEVKSHSYNWNNGNHVSFDKYIQIGTLLCGMDCYFEYGDFKRNLTTVKGKSEVLYSEFDLYFNIEDMDEEMLDVLCDNMIIIGKYGKSSTGNLYSIFVGYIEREGQSQIKMHLSGDNQTEFADDYFLKLGFVSFDSFGIIEDEIELKGIQVGL